MKVEIQRQDKEVLMNAKTVIMDFSGVYKEENFYQGKDAQWLDFTKMTGVNCYCKEEAEEEIK